MPTLYSWAWVEERVGETAARWDGLAGGSAPGGIRYGVAEQRFHESAYDEGLVRVERSVTREQAIDAFGRFSGSALSLSEEATRILTEEFLPVGTGLLDWARGFDPELSMADIIQACRNAWTACGMQPLLGLPVRLTPAILGYSLLYPYSDNYLDEQGVSAGAKVAFSQRFRRRLRGEEIEALNARERALWALIETIEKQYPRVRYPQVFDSMLAIHQAQEESIGQVGCTGDVLRMSCGKGGTSVLADAVLACPELSAEEELFAFEWGVLLQLGDDLQDIREDLRRGSATLFTRAASRGKKLDALAVQLLNFGEAVGARMDGLPQGSEVLKKLLKMSWRQLIVRAISDSHEHFSTGFLEEAEGWSPFRFEFLRARNAQVASSQGLYARIFEAFTKRGRPRTKALNRTNLLGCSEALVK